MDVNLHSLFTRVIGDGSTVSFWNDLWIGDSKLSSMFPRIFSLETSKECTVHDCCNNNHGPKSRTWEWRRPIRGPPEECQLANLLSLIQDVDVVAFPHSWECNLDPSKTFTVSALRKKIDSCILGSTGDPTSWYQEPKFLIKMSPRRSEGEESEYPFFEGDGSSSDEWGYYGVAGEDYEGPPVFDDDPYEEEIVSGDVGKGFVDDYPNFQEDENNLSYSGVVLRVEEESMPIYDTDFEDVIEEEGFVGKGGFGVLDGVVPTTPSKGVEGSTSIITQEHDALLAAATEISKQAQKGIEIIDDPQNCVTTKGQGKGNSRGRNMRSSRNSSIKKDDENKKEATLVNESGLSSANKDKEVENILANENSTSGVSFLKKHVDTSESDKRIPPVHFYAYESGQKVLDILKPSEIIVYHPDIAFVREIKVYKAENPSKKVKVYFLFYEDSTEVQKFEASICRENGAFESLIRQKSMMIQLVDQVAHGR
ncbi:hypothetical protein Tco_0401941 [Tanacetum coccineum]